MSTITPTLCNMCGIEEMIQSPSKSGNSEYMVCPNCDNWEGKTPPKREEDEDLHN